jgi:hypothetical protein
MRSGTVVGSFKIDLKTVYDAPGRVFKTFLIINYSLFMSCGMHV